MAAKRAPRKEKVPEPTFTVVRFDDARVPKYLSTRAAYGFSREHALALAAPAKGQKDCYTILPLYIHHAARASGRPISATEAVLVYSEQLPEED